MQNARKTILFLHHTSDVGGASWSLYQIIDVLRHDYNVAVALPQPGPLSSRLASELNVRVIADRRITPFTTAFGGSGSLLRRANRKGILGWSKAIAAAREICQREKPDIVHLNSFILFNSAIGCKQAGVPRVILHAREALLFKSGSWRDRLMRKTLRENVDHVFAITKTHAAEVALPERTTVVPNWSDFAGRSEKIDLHQSYGISPNHKVILCMGERQPHKGSLSAIEAFCQLDHSNAILLVLGGKPSGGFLKQTIRQTLNTLRIPTYGLRLDWAAAKNPDKIRLAGSSLNVQSLMAQSAFLVSPFIRPHFAKTVIEAASLGKTSILSAGAPQDESILDGKTGILVPPGDSTALAKAMERLLKNPEEAERMGAAAKDFVSKHYNKEHSIKLIRQAYEG